MSFYRIRMMVYSDQVRGGRVLCAVSEALLLHFTVQEID